MDVDAVANRLSVCGAVTVTVPDRGAPLDSDAVAVDVCGYVALSLADEFSIRDPVPLAVCGVVCEWVDVSAADGDDAVRDPVPLRVAASDSDRVGLRDGDRVAGVCDVDFVTASDAVPLPVCVSDAGELLVDVRVSSRDSDPDNVADGESPPVCVRAIVADDECMSAREDDCVADPDADADLTADTDWGCVRENVASSSDAVAVAVVRDAVGVLDPASV